MKNAYFCWHKQKKCCHQHNHINFLMKIKNSYDSCYIYKVSCPLHNFFLEKLAQANLSYPPPRPTGYDDKIPQRDRVKLILSERLSNSLWGSDILLFSEFINIVSILSHNSIEFIISLHHFFVISFVRNKEYLIWQISFSKFSDVLRAFTCASAIVNPWSICLGVSVLRGEWSETLARWAKSEERPFLWVGFIVLLPLKALIFNCKSI